MLISRTTLTRKITILVTLVLALFPLDAQVPYNNGEDYFTNGVPIFTGSIDDLLKLESKPGADKVIFMDFSDLLDENNNIRTDVARPYVTKQGLYELWFRGIVPFETFEVNITTNKAIYDKTPPSQRMPAYFPNALLSPIGQTGMKSGLLGDDFGDPTVHVNTYLLGSIASVASVYAHEIGHSASLAHDGDNTQPFGKDYAVGYDDYNWTPIMGMGGNGLNQWSKGEYNGSKLGHGTGLGPGELQDDLAYLAATFGAISDDHAITTLAFSTLNEIDAIQSIGVINNDHDLDTFSFEVETGATIDLLIKPIEFSTMLDIYAKVIDENDNLIVESNVPMERHATLQATLPKAGKYYLVIGGGGEGNPMVAVNPDGTKGGFTKYGSIGRYRISGIVNNRVLNNQVLAAITNLQGFNACGSLNPTFDLSNTGLIPLQSAKVTVKQNGTLLQSYNLTGLNLGPNASTTLNIPEIITQGTNALEIDIVELNGQLTNQPLSSALHKTVSYNLQPGEMMEFSIAKTGHDDNMQWDIKNQEGTLVAFHNPAEVVDNGTHLTQQFCLAKNDCYSLRVIKAFPCDISDYRGRSYQGGSKVMVLTSEGDYFKYSNSFWVDGTTAPPSSPWSKSGVCDVFSEAGGNFTLKNIDAGTTLHNIGNTEYATTNTFDFCTSTDLSCGVTKTQLTSSNSNPQCEGSVTLTPILTGTELNLQYEFFKDNISIQGPGTINTFEASDNANYSVRVTSTSNTACDVISTVFTPLIDFQPTVNAGADQSIHCSDSDITLDATVPEFGTGKWTVTKGSAYIKYEGDPKTPISELNGGDNILTWTVTNGVCPPVTEDVTITVTGATESPFVDIKRIDTNQVCSLDTLPILKEYNQIIVAVDTSTLEFSGEFPTYQWYLDGQEITFYPNTSYQYWEDKDQIYVVKNGKYSELHILPQFISGTAEVKVVMTSSHQCVTQRIATSQTIYVEEVEGKDASIEITAFGTEFCAGDEIKFDTIQTTFIGDIYGNNKPYVEWMVNGKQKGFGGSKFDWSSITLADGDIVHAKISNREFCATKRLTSNEIEIKIVSSVEPTVTISSETTSLCGGDPVKAKIVGTVGGGVSPQFEWFINGQTTGIHGEDFQSTTIQNGDQLTVKMTNLSNCAVGTEAISNPIDFTFGGSSGEALIQIELNKTTICPNEEVVFSITNQANEGTSPSYQWLLNGVNTNETGTSYTSTTLQNGDVVSLELTSSESCLVKDIDTSNTVSITFKSVVTPTVTIEANKTTICPNEEVAFTIMNQANEGTSPSYQWFVNANALGEVGKSFTTTTLNNEDSVFVQLTSSETCVSNPFVISNKVGITVSEKTTPSIEINSINTSICTGEVANFGIKEQLHEGVNPAYRWLINNSPTLETGLTFNSSTLQDGDQISLEMTSSEACLTQNIVTSTVITVEVTNSLTPTLTISPSDTSICLGASITFEITEKNGLGSNPSYEWFINNQSIGVFTADFTSNRFINGDIIEVQASNLSTCSSESEIKSNTSTITVKPIISPSVVIMPNDTTICEGSELVYEIETSTNLGSNPVYEWFINTVSQGINTKKFSYNNFKNNDVVSVKVSNLSGCVSTTETTSNLAKIFINKSVTPSLTIEANKNIICTGEEVIFNILEQTHQGLSPSYKWLLNNIPTTEIGVTFSSTTLKDGDEVSVEMTSSANCVPQVSISSNTVPTNVEELNLSIDLATSYCVNVDTEIKATATAGSTVNWYDNTTNTLLQTANNTLTLTKDQVNIGMEIRAELSLKSGLICSNTVAVIETLNVIEEVPIEVNLNEIIICQGDETSIKVTSNLTSSIFSWHKAELGHTSGPWEYLSNTGIRLENIKEEGLYKVELQNDPTSCFTPAYSKVEVIDMKIEEVTMTSGGVTSTDLIVPLGEQITFSTQVSPSFDYEYKWNIDGEEQNGTDNPYVLTTTEVGENAVNLEVIHPAHNCSIKYEVGDFFVNETLSISNAFTPNSDGINDVWNLEDLNVWNDVSLKVFNRWGNLVYDNPSISWDGTHNSEPCPVGTYYYIIEIKDPSYLGPKELKGFVVIIR